MLFSTNPKKVNSVHFSLVNMVRCWKGEGRGGEGSKIYVKKIREGLKKLQFIGGGGGGRKWCYLISLKFPPSHHYV